MKRIHIFIYSKGSLTPDTIIFHVRVGKSVKDQKAHAWLTQLAKSSTDFFYAKNTNEVADFLNAVAKSLIPAKNSRVPSVSWLRHDFIEVTELARFLKNSPAELLNAKAETTKITYADVVSGLIDEPTFIKRAV